MITNTLQEQIGEPLYTVIKHCKAIEEDPIVHEDVFQDFISKIKSTRQLASVITFKLKDMRDWQMLSQGRFSKNIITFCLEDAIQEVVGMMKIRADLKGIRLFVDEEKKEDYNLSPRDESRPMAKDKLPVYVTGDM